MFADIQSSNIVGYTGKAVEANTFYLIATQFDKTGSESGKIDMNDLLTLSETITPGTYDSNFAGAPEIQVLNASGSGYDKYYYISDATDDDDNYLGYDCWADTDGYELTDSDKLDLGKGFWFKSAKAGTITTAGQVKGEASAVVSFPGNQFYIMSSPFPIAVSLANVTTAGIVPGTYDSNFANASEIQVLNASASGYDKYYYISDATDDKDDYVGYNCWSDTDGYILEGTQIDAGCSFWIKGNGAGSIGFTR